MYVQNLLGELNFNCNEFIIFADNTSTIKIAQSNAYSDRTKHIDTRYMWMVENSKLKQIIDKHVSTNENIADFLTKPLTREKHETFTALSGLKA